MDFCKKDKVDSGRLFKTYRKKLDRYIAEPVGKNTLAKYCKSVAEFLHHDVKLYTGHCWRRSGATALANAGETITNLKRIGRWRSDQVCEGYIEDSENFKEEAASMLSGQKRALPAAAGGPPLKKVKKDFDDCSFQNCSNITINFNAPQ